LPELRRALAQYDVDLKRELDKELKSAAEPVRLAAQGLADAGISRIGHRWDRMRIGVTSKSVYVAPASRRRGGSPRPNLGNLLLERALMPALDGNEDRIVASLEAMLDRLGSDAGF